MSSSPFGIDILTGYHSPSSSPSSSESSLLSTLSEDDDDIQESEIDRIENTDAEEYSKPSNDANKNTVSSKDIQFVFDTMSKQAPYDKIQIKQIFYGICSSQTSTKIHHNINSKNSGEGKSYDLKLVSDFFPDSITLKFNNMTDKALYHQNGVEAVKDENTGKYEELKPILNELVSEIEELQDKIDDEESKEQNHKDRKSIKFWKSEIRKNKKSTKI